ncbi:MAG TPA: GNAT family N-acetyltransferase [Longimicrobiales bacterium]|nr:GNAT family N-acetyltransferase [Longimicrobiales bacterium]
MSHRIVRHASPAAFLGHAGGWLLEAEDRHNVMLGILYAQAGMSAEAAGIYLATVERDGRVVGCCMRTPYGVLLTEMPEEPLDALVQDLAAAHDAIANVHGPPDVACGFADRWIARAGGRRDDGHEQRLYRLDEVCDPPEVPGGLRHARSDEAGLVEAWGDAFARETHLKVGPSRATIEAWIRSGSLWMWEDHGPACMAVAHGRTPRGIRIGYVFTPHERRRRGYAAACVAALSRRMLASGLAFCVLFAEASNPTTNRLYQRIGYRHVTDVREYEIHPEAST